MRSSNARAHCDEPKTPAEWPGFYLRDVPSISLLLQSLQKLFGS
jgi:hypothetical protein